MDSIPYNLFCIHAHRHESYAWLWGIEGVSGSTSFSDAVAIFNESWGTDFTEEETLNLMGYDVCWLYGLCE